MTPIRAVWRRIIGTASLVLAAWLAPAPASAFTEVPWVVSSTWGATNAQGMVELTNNGQAEGAVAWNPCPVSLNTSWNMQFTFNFGINHGPVGQLCGGDGMSIILQAANNANATGYGPAGNNGEKGFITIPNSLEIAFNTYVQPYMDTYNACTSLNVLVDGHDEASGSDVVGCGAGITQVVTSSSGCYPSASYTECDLRDGANHTVSISYNAGSGQLTVAVDGNPNPPTWTLPPGYIASIFGGDASVLYGVGASSGTATNVQSFEQNSPAATCGGFPTPTTGVPDTINDGTDNCPPNVIPTFTPANTATATPTPSNTPTAYPTICGTPQLISGANLADGCMGGTANPSFAIANPGGPGQLLVVQLDYNLPNAPTGMSYGGQPLTLLTTFNPDVYGMTIATWYLLNPPAGGSLTVSVPANQCNWNLAYSLWDNVNQTTPFGTVATVNHAAATLMSDNLTTQSAYSVILDFLSVQNGGTVTISGGETASWPKTSSSYGPVFFGEYLNTGAPGPYSLTYSDSNAYEWTSQMVEIKGVSCAVSTPTNTSTFTPTKTNTPTNTNTNTNTFTPTYTNTFTPTNTSTFTSTKTNTPTNTNTFTPTNTSTFTPTNTNTFTPTKTNTPTNTNTFTPTNTNTFTPTNTNTFTPTKSNTPTNTNTNTSTYTPTSTGTFTPTNTNTNTSTFTSTKTNTPTNTNTNTNTPTYTNTFTPTNTNTNTPTKTDTPVPNATDTFTNTITDTNTNTNTPTSTNTFTPTSTPTKTFTNTNTLTNTNTPTNTDTNTNTNTPTLTDTNTNTPTNTNTYTPTSTPTNTSTNTNTYTNTNTATKTNTPVPPTSTFSDTATQTDSPTETASPSPSATFTSTETFTVSPTAVPDNYSVTVNIYNSAGELVRGLYSGSAEYPANQAQVLQTANQAGGVQVDITGLGGSAGSNLVWNGTNNGGQAVGGGSYYVQISSVNSFGQVQTLDKTVSVVGTGGPVTLSVYNSAGELVANLNSELPLASQATDMSLPPGQNSVVSSTDPSGGGLKITLTLAGGGTTTVPWNGLNSQGQPLQAGNYLLTLTQIEAGSNENLKTLPVVVVGAPDSSAKTMAHSALVVPNPVEGGWFDVQYQPAGTDMAVGVLYSLAGQRVAEATDSGSGTLHFSGDWSSGIYLLDFEVHNGDSGALARRILKVAVVR
jgi:hypothetical protein